MVPSHLPASSPLEAEFAPRGPPWEFPTRKKAQSAWEPDQSSLLRTHAAPTIFHPKSTASLRSQERQRGLPCFLFSLAV